MKKCAESDRMYIENVKRKKDMHVMFVYLPTRFDFNLFFSMQKYSSKLF